MIDFGEFQPFEGAENDPPDHLRVLSKRPPGGPMRFGNGSPAARPPENLADMIRTAPTDADGSPARRDLGT